MLPQPPLKLLSHTIMMEEAPLIVHDQRGDEDGDSSIGDIDSALESNNISMRSKTRDYVKENG